jgi:hypothetical protein
MDVEGTPITATLDDREIVRDFAALPPLAPTLDDYAATEKMSGLPRRPSIARAPAGTNGRDSSSPPPRRGS